MSPNLLLPYYARCSNSLVGGLGGLWVDSVDGRAVMKFS